jgi:hypothetical protein
MMPVPPAAGSVQSFGRGASGALRRSRFGVAVLLLLALAACDARTADPADPGAGGSPRPAAPAGHLRQAAVAPPPHRGSLTHWTRCGLLDSPGSANAEVPACSAAAPEDAAEPCPRREDLVLVVDDDAWTRMHRSWRWLEERPWGLSSQVCQRTGGPQPLAHDLPQTCETLQRLGAAGGLAGGAVPCEPLSQTAHLQERGADRTQTPARRALERACDGLLSSAPGRMTPWAVAVLAFDGVPDEEGAGSPEGEFAASLAHHCVARGVGVHVAARPETYRYLYVLSAPGHHEFAGEVAGRLAVLLDEADPVVSGFEHAGRAASRAASPRGPSAPRQPALALRLTPDRLALPGERRAVAALRLERARLEGYEGDPRQSFDPGRGYGAELGITALNLTRWLAAEEANRAGWEMHWTADRDRWQQLASAGTLLSPPEVYGNEPGMAAQRPSGVDAAAGSRPHAPGTKLAAAWQLRADLGYRELAPQDCPAVLERGHAGWTGEPEDCPRPAARLYQSATLETGKLSVELFRDPTGGLGWLRAPGSLAPQAGPTVPAVEDVHDPVYLRSVAGTAGAPLASFALVSPALTIDPCAVALHEALLNSFARVSRSSRPGGEETLSGVLVAPAVTAACEKSPLRGIWHSFQVTGSTPFRVTVHRPATADDLRVGMETLVNSIFECATVVTGLGPGRRASKVAGPCLLGGLRVVYECPLVQPREGE